MMILINGGSSSGKSAFAETLIVEQAKKEEVMAEAAGKSMRGGARKTDLRHQPSFYLATMIAWDEECRERIRKHRKMREKKNFMTIECPVDRRTRCTAGTWKIRRMARWNGHWKESG